MQPKQTKTYLRNDINPKHGRKNLTKFWVVPWISNQRALEEEAIFFLAVPTLGPASWANSATTTPKLTFRCYCILDNHLRLGPLPYTASASLFLTSVLCATSASSSDGTISPNFGTTALPPASRSQTGMSFLCSFPGPKKPQPPPALWLILSLPAQDKFLNHSLALLRLHEISKTVSRL